jgi:DNA-binding LytR/AlgR family response regulator
MDILIVEDEQLAAERLASLLTTYDPTFRVLDCLDAVEDTVQWLRSRPAPHLLMLDIHLADGLGFDIFQQVDVRCPIIFTTAYDQYAIQAFKVNSIDYLLKPIAFPDLARAIDKLRLLTAEPAVVPSPTDFRQVAAAVRELRKTYKTRFIVRYHDRILFKPTEEVAYFCADGKVLYLITLDQRRYVVDYTLEQLEELLDPAEFYRLNRKFMVRLAAIKDIRTYLGGRLKLLLQPATDGEVIVSRERVADFKAWLDK